MSQDAYEEALGYRPWTAKGSEDLLTEEGNKNQRTLNVRDGMIVRPVRHSRRLSVGVRSELVYVDSGSRQATQSPALD